MASLPEDDPIEWVEHSEGSPEKIWTGVRLNLSDMRAVHSAFEAYARDRESWYRSLREDEDPPRPEFTVAGRRFRNPDTLRSFADAELKVILVSVSLPARLTLLQVREGGNVSLRTERETPASRELFRRVDVVLRARTTWLRGKRIGGLLGTFVVAVLAILALNLFVWHSVYVTTACLIADFVFLPFIARYQPRTFTNITTEEAATQRASTRWSRRSFFLAVLALVATLVIGALNLARH